MNAPIVKCEICGLGPLSPDFKRDPQSIALYWANPDLIKDLGSPKYFCGPAHSTEWFVSRKSSS